MLQRICWVITVVFILCVSPTVGEQAPAGSWQSVDFVRNVEDFTPGKKSWKGGLSLKEFQCSATGTASMGWSCIDGWTTHRDGKTKHRYFRKQMAGDEYLFLPWLSGDVTTRGQKPFYYVLKKVPDKPVKEFDNVRWKDLSRLDLSKQPGLIATLWFNEKTLWPKAITKRGDYEPRKLLIQAMNPGLGVRELHQHQAESSYQYCGRGGLSWSIPYCAGVLALGWQLRPDLTAARMQECLFNSAFVTSKGAKIINPKKFITMIKTITKRNS